MIKPTVGRVVYYYPEKGQPEQAAIVAKVHDDRCVNLMVIIPDGRTVGMTSIRLAQPEDEIPVTGPYCAWMPFQVGQSQAVKDAQSQVKS